MKQHCGTRARAIMLGFILAFALASLTPQGVQAAQTVPEGFCQSYLLLGELSQPYADAPNRANARLDYLTDGAGVTQDTLIPTVGATVNVNFSVAASTGWQGSPNTIQAPTITGNIADYSVIYGDLSNLMTYGWTYVENGTGSSLDTYLGLATDDTHIAVLNGVEIGFANGWHNNQLVDEVYPVTLLPGKNLLMVKVFEGGGGHNLRLRFQPTTANGDVTGTPGETGVTYTIDPAGYGYPAIAVANRTLPANGLYGAGLTLTITVTVNKTTGNPEPTVTETVPAGWTVGTITTSLGAASAAGGTITWNVGTMGVNTATMTYQVTAAGTGVATFTGRSDMVTVSHGAVSLKTGGNERLSDQESGQNAVGFAREWLLLGEYLRAGGGGNNPTVAHMQSDFLTDGGAVNEPALRTALPVPYQAINTNFGVAASTGFNPGNLGFSAPTPFLWVDPDDTILMNGIFGAFDDLMTYGWVIARNKTGAPLNNIYVGVGSDDAHLVYVNGVEVGNFTQSGGRGAGAANQVQNAHGPFTLNPGDNVILMKAFEGGGDHSFRLRLQTNNSTPNPATAATMVPIDQAELLVRDSSYALARRTLQALQGYYVPGQAVPITVTVTRAKGVPNVAVTETLPAGWTATITTTTLGSASAAGNVVTWNVGPMVVNTATITYNAIPPAGASGNVTINGTVVSGANNFVVTGDSTILGPVIIPGDTLFEWHGDIGQAPLGQAGGNPSIPGSASKAGTVYTLTGAGADFWGTVDRGHYAGKKQAGGFIIEGTVAWVDPGVNTWSKAVLMWRNSVQGTSAMANEGLRNPANSAGVEDTIMQWRVADGRNAEGSASYPPSPEPVLARLVRFGSTAKGFWFNTATSTWVPHDMWILPGVDPYSDVVVGVGITSHEDNGGGVDTGVTGGADYATANFDAVGITPLAVGAAVRTLGSTTYNPGQPIQVTIDVVHQANVPALTVTEVLPTGWVAQNISNGGAQTGTSVTWTLNFQGDTLLTYDLWPAGGATSYFVTITGYVLEPTAGNLLISGDNRLAKAEPPVLVAWWPLDEGSGTTANDIVGNHDMTLNGAAWNVGIFGQSLVFDGLAAYADTAGGTYLNARAGSIALWFWTNQAASADIGPMLYGTQSGGDGFGGNEEIHLHIDEDGNIGRVEFFIEGDSVPAGDVNYNTGSTPIYNDGVWHHAVVTWVMGGQCITYIDGVRRAAANHNAASFDCTDSNGVILGTVDTRTSARRYNGALDDVRIYDGPLSAAEVLALYGSVPNPGAATAPTAPTGLSSTLVSGNNVSLSWTDNSANEDGFIVERRQGASGPWIHVGQVGGTSFVDPSLALNETYTYRVRAFNDWGESANTNEASETTEAVLGIPIWRLYR